MTAKKKSSRIGRPPKEGARRYTIRITDQVAAFYREAGAGNLTAGIEHVAQQKKPRRA